MEAAQTSNRLLREGAGLTFTWEVDRPYHLPRALFGNAVAREGLRHLTTQQFAAGNGSLDEVERLATVEFAHRSISVDFRLLRFASGALAFVQIVNGSADVDIAAASGDDLERALSSIADALQPIQEAPNEVPITFWASDSRGPISAHRRIEGPAWDEIAANHAEQTGVELTNLMSARGPGTGRLVLWHGEPGTGKTHAVKALVREWRSWCIPHFISDPEVFLGENSSYLMRVLTSDDREHGQDREWKLVILEDAGELLAADARARTGQALSRLLNVTDGLMGQGMNALVLVTTNEPLRKLHPAVQRPGRCWADVEFGALSVAEANAWLARNGSTVQVDCPTPVADLYAILKGCAVPAGGTFGFAAA